MAQTKIDGPYSVDEDGLTWSKVGGGKDAEIGLLTNFTAQIDEQFVYHDGPRTNTVLKISGQMLDKDGEIVQLKPVTIDATEFKAMSWISQKWGMKPIMYPMSSVERDIATIMQIVSDPKTSNIYTHTGWAMIEGKLEYLTMSGGIGKTNVDNGLTVQLPAELQLYALPDPKVTVRADVFASLALLKIGPANVMWPALLATYRAALGPADFAIFIAGRTGTFKSELGSLLQSHYGVGMNARKLPASWNSTGNALQALAYRAKDALIVIDDYVLVGASHQQKSLAGKVDEVIRAQGNQAGRTRLTDTSSIQGTMYPRGIILGTGEDVPEGHSIRGRMLITELSPGDIPNGLLTTAQAARQSYSAALASWIRWIAKTGASEKIKAAADIYRDTNLGVGHSRTPSIMGDLMATAEFMSDWMTEEKWLSAKQAADFAAKAHAALKECGISQKQYLTTADPVQIFCVTIKQMVQLGKAHFKTKNGGVPQDAELYGWLKQQTYGEEATYKAQGPQLGWIDFEKDELLLDQNSLPAIKKASDGKLAVTDQTFAKRLKDAGLLTRIDAARARNSIRIMLEGHSRLVLAIRLADVFGDGEDEPGAV